MMNRYVVTSCHLRMVAHSLYFKRLKKTKDIEDNIRLIDKTRAELVDKMKRLKKGNEDS